MERILRLAGLPTDKDRDDFVFIVLREQTPDKRKQIIGYMLENMPDGKVQQGCIEGSNVNVVDEMVKMITISRAYHTI